MKIYASKTGRIDGLEYNHSSGTIKRVPDGFIETTRKEPYEHLCKDEDGNELLLRFNWNPTFKEELEEIVQSLDEPSRLEILP